MRIYYIIVILLISLNSFATNLNYNNVQGKWRLMYKRNYGYEFRFQNNYISYAILYYGTSALVFKGIYSLEGNEIRININAMKNEANIHRINFRNKFVKTSSSYFIFNGEFQGNKTNKILILKPLKTIIDGNESNGYFEPEVKLKRSY